MAKDNNQANEITLENLANQATPLNLEPVVDDESQDLDDKRRRLSRKSTVGSLVEKQNMDGGHDVTAAQKDAAQHMRAIRNFVVGVAVINSAKQHHRAKKYMKTSKDFERFQEAYNSVKTNGQGGRSVEEILMEDNMKKAKKRMEKMAQKWPNLQKPMSLSQKFQTIFRTSKQGISEALRAQTMKGVAQASTGSDLRAVMAASNAGYVPGTASMETSSEMSL